MSAPPPGATVQAITANRLDDGDVVFWDARAAEHGRPWVARFADATLYDEPAPAELALDVARAQATVVIDPYLIDVKIEDGLPIPIAYRERVRALGPTIHPDIGKQAEGGPVIDAIAHASGAARSSGRLGLIRRK